MEKNWKLRPGFRAAFAMGAKVGNICRIGGFCVLLFPIKRHIIMEDSYEGGAPS